ncbi:hypothetical protein [Sporosarcina aquimarina]|uniref:hypothetical protein n=1 Tax=Sporosarcina aquimarina TaxID=114975 RepID=UPI00295ED605|nr:hypothetical protein [Sporosarcina aquimarina]
MPLVSGGLLLQSGESPLETGGLLLQSGGSPLESGGFRHPIATTPTPKLIPYPSLIT